MVSLQNDRIKQRVDKCLKKFSLFYNDFVSNLDQPILFVYHVYAKIINFSSNG